MGERQCLRVCALSVPRRALRGDTGWNLRPRLCEKEALPQAGDRISVYMHKQQKAWLIAKRLLHFYKQEQLTENQTSLSGLCSTK